jgi:O-antigen ligase
MFPGVEDLFLHGQTVRGQALGIMQVVNHHATLLLMALPFLAVAVSRLHTRYELGDPDPAGAIMALLFSVVILAGIVASGSVAGYVLTAPVLFASGLIILGRQSGRVFTLAGLGIAVLFAGIAYMVASSPNLDGIGVTDLSNSPLSRRNVYATTIVAIQDHLPFGSGLGSFASLYPGYENGADIMPSFIAHAHNEYLEIALELGIPGILLLIAGCGWVTVTSVKAWRASQVEGGRLKKAASIGAFIVVLHCAVDFPIRTETIACLFAYCLGVLATKPGSGGLSIPPETENQARHRHVVI